MKLQVTPGKIFVFAVKTVLFIVALLTAGLYVGEIISESPGYALVIENLCAVTMMACAIEASACLVDIIRDPSTERTSLGLYTLVFVLTLVVLLELGRASNTYNSLSSGLIKSSIVASFAYGAVSQIDPHRKPNKVIEIPFSFHW